jgi:nitrite reductase (NADH) large subunit
MTRGNPWRFVCELDEVLPESGVCALLDGRQIALFRVGDAAYALDNFDPASEANVLARGLVGDLQGEFVVASPIYKHHYALKDGRCLESPEHSVRSYPVRVNDGCIYVKVTAGAVAEGKRKLVVIGNGMAGMRVVEELLTLAPDAYDITVFGAEPHGNYNRILLSPLLAGEKDLADIMLHTFEWYEKHGVELHVNDPVVAIDRIKRVVHSQKGCEIRFDRLLLATGSKPFVPPIPGTQLKGVVTFRDLQDVDAMLGAARRYKKAIVIGGGLLGLEAAGGLLKQGMEVTVVHLLDTLMERQLDFAASALLKEQLERRGYRFHMPAKTRAILGTERVTGVAFEDGCELQADLVVMAAGIRPNTDLAKATGLRCERGVLVSDTMQTYDPAIYSVGECVQHRNSTYGLVAPLWEQAKVCATHLAEFGIGHYRGSTLSAQLKVSGIDLFSAGDLAGDASTEDLVLRDPKRGVYKRLIIKDNKVRGAILYGDTRDGAWYHELISKGRNIADLRDQLLFGSAFAEPRK